MDKKLIPCRKRKYATKEEAETALSELKGQGFYRKGKLVKKTGPAGSQMRPARFLPSNNEKMKTIRIDCENCQTNVELTEDGHLSALWCLSI